MKKKIVKRLTLHRDTIRTFEDRLLSDAAGGNTTECISAYAGPANCGPSPKTHSANE